MPTQLHAPMYVEPEHSGFCTIINKSHAQLGLLHSHDYHEIVFIIAGQANHLVNGKMSLLKKGEIVFLAPEDEHCFPSEVSDDFAFYNIIIRDSLFENTTAFLGKQVLDSITMTRSNPLQLHLNIDQFNYFNQTLNRLYKYPKTSSERYNTAISLCLIEILSLLYFRNNLIIDQSIPKWMNELIIKAHEPEIYFDGVGRLQELANCTKEHLCRSFKKYFNLSPTDFINNIRLEEAAVRIIYSTESIIDISADVGFNNLSHFYHLFKQKYHVSPGQYRVISGQKTPKSAVI